jgi:putative phage-type endonuclease
MKPIIRTEIQGSAEWHSLRNKMISATNIAPIMSLSPWKTALMLWEEKLGLREPEKMNSKMEEGMMLEGHALAFFNKKKDSDFKPIVLQHGNIQYLMASLDGMNSNGEVLEIKCGKGSHELAKQGIVPEYYYSQVQCQLFCSNASEAYYFSYRSDDDNILLTVNRDEKFIEKMLVAVDIFHRNLLNFTPPLATDRDFIKRDSRELQFHLEVWKQTKAEIKLLEAKDELLRDTIINMCEGQSSECNGVRIAKTTTKGRIDYSKIDALKEIDLEIYRSKPVTSFRFTEMKQE